MKETWAPVLLVVFLIGAAIAAGACSRAAPGPDVTAVRAYADTATRTALEGLSEDNLAKYTQYADAQFKAAVTQNVLDKTAAQVTGQLGTFVSITFLRTETQGEYTIVHYTAKFSKGDVGVRMVFDRDHLIAGQWFE